MAQVPYSPVASVEPDESQGNSFSRDEAPANAFGAANAEATQKLGETISNIGQVWGQVQTDDQVNKFYEATEKRLNDFKALRGQDAADAQAGVLAGINEDWQSARNGLFTGMQKVAFDRETRRYRAVYANGSVASHGDEQRKFAAGQIYDSKFKNALTGIFNLAGTTGPVADSQFQDFIHQAEDAATKHVQANGMGNDPDAMQNAINVAHSAIYKTWAEALEPNDPAAAMKLVEAHRAELGPEYQVLHDRLKMKARSAIAQGAVNEEIAKAKAAQGGTAYAGGKPPAAAPSETGQPASYHQQVGGSMGWQEQAKSIPASGYGRIDVPYNRPLEAKGLGGFGASDLFQYLRSQGASTNEALVLTGAAANESGLNPGAWHDNRTGYGLWGHKLDRLNLIGMGWRDQARAALAELRRRPESGAVNSAKNPQELAAAEMAYESPQGYTPGHPESGHNYRGRLATLTYFQQMANGVYAGNNGAPIAGPVVTGGGKPLMSAPGYGMEAFQPPPTVGGVPGTETPSPFGEQAPAPQPAAFEQPDKSAAAEPSLPGVADQREQELALAAEATKGILERSDLDLETKELALRQLEFYEKAAAIAAGEDARARKAKDDAASARVHNLLAQGKYQDAFGEVRKAADAGEIDDTKADLLTQVITRRSGKEDATTLGPSFQEIFSRIMLPPGTQGGVRDNDDILNAELSGQVTEKGATKLIQILAEHKKGENEGFNQMATTTMAKAKQKLFYGEEGQQPGALKDPKGYDAMMTFENMFWGEARDYAKEHPDMKGFRFFDPKQLDGILNDIRNPEQILRDKLTEMGVERPETNASIFGVPPNNTDATHWDTWLATNLPIIPDARQPGGGYYVKPQTWAKAVSILLTNPDARHIEDFNALPVGKAIGNDAVKILAEFGVRPHAAQPAPAPTPAPAPAPETPIAPEAPPDLVGP